MLRLNPKHIQTEEFTGVYTNQTSKEVEAAIRTANEYGKGYTAVRMLQQAKHEIVDDVRQHFARYRDCQDCTLGMCPFVQNKVFYRGYLPCDVLFVGEAPGKNEDAQAKPFIGAAGQILDQIITDTSERLYPGFDNGFRWCITNSVLCIPYPQDKDGWNLLETRAPTAEEIKTCSHKLESMIKLAQPNLIVSLGQVAHRAMKVQTLDCRVIEVPHPAWISRIIDEREQQLQIKKIVLTLEALLRETL